MKTKEVRKITIIYCDYCKSEIKGKFHTLYNKYIIDEKHFCVSVKEKEKHNCLVKYKQNKS